MEPRAARSAPTISNFVPARRRRRKRKRLKMGASSPKTKARLGPSSSRVGLVIIGQILLHSLLLLSIASPNDRKSSSLVGATMLTDYDGATFYKATVGSRVRIACNGSHWSDDSVSLLLWFKGSNSVPIYTVDARQKSLNNGARHFVSDAYKGRAKFNTRATPPYLDLAPLEEEDQAEYRCRVDYRARPRENFLVILFVLVPPKSVQVMDSNGRSLEQIYGPLSEGSDLTLLCLAKGGRPPPAITWRQRAKVIDDSYLTLNDFLALRQTGRLFPHLELPQNASSPSSAATAMAAGSQADGHDNNRRNEKVDARNPINGQPLDPSSGASSDNNQLESLYLEWRQWPEFDFFAHELDKLAGANANESGGAAESAPSRHVEADRKTANASSGKQLLELTVHESITTAANVLRLQSLGSARALAARGNPTVGGIDEPALEEQGDNQARAASAPEIGLSASVQLEPQLECEASNAHYDLRSLIKLFAPAAFVAPAASQEPDAGLPSTAVGGTERGAGPQVNSTELVGRQLVDAIEQALKVSTSSQVAVTADELEHREQQQQRQQQPIGESLSSPGKAALRQRAGSADNSPAGGDKWTANSQRLRWAAGVIYRQLARPHQLSGASNGPGISVLANNNNNNNNQPQATGAPTAQPATQPQSLSRSRLIALDVYLRPLDVRITTPQRPHAAGQPAEFVCTSSGSRPAAKLMWLMNGRPLEAKSWRQLDEPSGNASHSKLSVQLERQHHGAQLVCRAENEKLLELLAAEQPHGQPPIPSAIEDSRLLTVHYPPKLKLELGNKMLTSSIKEFSDIYFVCQVDANPPVREITWLHNERPLNESSASAPAGRGQGRPEVGGELMTGAGSRYGAAPPAAAAAGLPLHLARAEGLIMSNNSLVLQRVRMEQRGQYACVASNSEGVSESDRIELRVLHAPICRKPTQRAPTEPDQRQANPEPAVLSLGSRSLSLRSRARFLCQMEAEPPELELTWYLNNSRAERRVLFTGPVSSLAAHKSASASASAPANRNKKDQTSPAESDQSSAMESSRLAGAGGSGNSNNNNNNSNNRNSEEPDDGTDDSVALSQPRAARSTLVTSQLDYSLDSSLDYGQLYCVARNSMGEQKRACVYQIQAPDLDELAPAQTVSCIAASVTPNSVSLGCNHQEQAPESAARLYSYAVAVYRLTNQAAGAGEEQTPPLLQVDKVDTGEVKFNDAAAATGTRQPPDAAFMSDSSLNSAAQQDDAAADSHLVAHLSSGQLDEPLFSVAHLQPATNYELHVHSLDVHTGKALSARPSVVRFATEPAPTPSGANNSMRHLSDSAGRQWRNPTIEPVSEHQQQNLMAALISTRSANSELLTGAASSSGELAAPASTLNRHSNRWLQQQRQQQQQQTPQAGLLDKLWSLFQPRQRQQQQQHSRQSAPSSGHKASGASRARANENSIAANNQLMDLSDTFLITSVCLALLVSLILLLVLHRYSKLSVWSRRSQRRHSKSRASRSGSSISSSPGSNSPGCGGNGSEEARSSQCSSAKRQSQPDRPIDLRTYAPANSSGPLDSATAASASQGAGSGSDSGVTMSSNLMPMNFAPGADISRHMPKYSTYSSATLDVRLLNAAGQHDRQCHHSNCAGQLQQQQQPSRPRRRASVMLASADQQRTEADLAGYVTSLPQAIASTGPAATNQPEPIRVSRSRSSASVCRLDCPQYSGANVAVAAPKQQLHQQPQPRFIHLSSGIDRRLISDANLNIPGAELELRVPPPASHQQTSASPLAPHLAFQTETLPSGGGVNRSGWAEASASQLCNGSTDACLAASEKKRQLNHHLEHNPNLQGQFYETNAFNCLFGSRPQSSSLISDESSVLSANMHQQAMSFIELIPADAIAGVQGEHVYGETSSALFGQIVGNQHEFTTTREEGMGIDARTRILATAIPDQFHLHPTSITSSCSPGSPSTATAANKDQSSNSPPSSSTNIS